MTKSLPWRALRLTPALCSVLLTGLLLSTAPALAAGGIAFSGSIGESGSGNGQFKEPKGVAVNEATGDVYVVDKGNNRVEYFNSAGIFQHQFNGTEIDGVPAGAGKEAPAKFSEPEAIAIDNDSMSSSHGDVYVTDTGHDVIDKFSPSGSYIAQLTGPGAGTFSGSLGVTVDSKGNLWVNEQQAIDEFSSELAFLSQFATSFNMSPGIALDAADQAYVLTAEHNVKKLGEEGGIHPLFEPSGCDCDTALALDRPTGDLYVDETTRVTEYNLRGALIEQFGVGELTGGAGVAVDAATGALYAADTTADVVRSTSSPTRVSVEACGGGGGLPHPANGGYELCAAINPHGTTVEDCKLEFGAQAGTFTQQFACETAGLSGEEPAEVHARVTGLAPGKTYYYRFSATNKNGTELGPEEHFKTEPVPPIVISESVSAVAEGYAILEAQINPGGEATYYAEYGTGACGANTCGAKTSGEGFVLGDTQEEGSLELTNLKPNTTYHYWVVVVNSAAPAGVHGEAKEFTTLESQAEILGRILAEGAPAREAERQAKAAKEQAEREAAANHKKEEEAAPKKKKEAEPPATGSVSLAATSVTVQRDGTALVKLECLGISSCHGKLTLSAKRSVKGKGGKNARKVMIGTVSFSIPGDESKTVKLAIDAAGRALLSTDHGHLSARLAILELAPSPKNTQTKTVQLVQRKAHGKTKKGSRA